MTHRCAKLKTRMSTTRDLFDPWQVSKRIFNPYTCENNVNSFYRLSGDVQGFVDKKQQLLLTSCMK